MPKINFPKGNVWKEFKLDTELIIPNIIKFELRYSSQKNKTKSTFERIEIKKEDFEKGKSKEELSESIIEKQIFLAELIQSAVDNAISLIVDWDLTDKEDNKIPCTEDNKKLMLDGKEGLIWERIIPEEIEDEEEQPDIKPGIKYLFSEINTFCSNVGNFSKN